MKGKSKGKGGKSQRPPSGWTKSEGKSGPEDGGKGGGKKGKSKGSSGGKGRIKCFRCQGFGHMARDCATDPADAVEEEPNNGVEEEGLEDAAPDMCCLEEETGGVSCGYLTRVEDDEIYGVEAEAEGGMTKITAVVDSGAGANVLPKDMISFIPTRETERSRSGKGFVGASGHRIRNYGEKRVVVRTSEGHERGTNWQVADVRRPLMSVGRMTQAGNRVSLSQEDPHILNVKTGQITKLRKEGNVFVVDLWVVVPGSSTKLKRVAQGSTHPGKNRSSCEMEVDNLQAGRRVRFPRQAK